MLRIFRTESDPVRQGIGEAIGVNVRIAILRILCTDEIIFAARFHAMHFQYQERSHDSTVSGSW
jgi:hypothetical protein